MAKKTISTESAGDSIFDLIKSVDNSAEILSESSNAIIEDYIDTGCYILNACMTGSLFKGIPSGRVLCLAGAPGSGKSFLAISACREAQKKGYTPIYMDSEGAIDKDFVMRLGCDASKMIIKQVTTISEVSTFMANLLQKVNAIKKSDRPKLIFVLDSLGNLTSTKELSDTLDANGKRDMTKAQETKALFRTNATALAKAQAPFIVTSHIYMTQDLFAKTVVSGGCLISEEEIITKTGNKPIKDIQIGEYVLSADGTFQEVLKTFNYKKDTITFTFDNGEMIECSKDHKFLVGKDPNDEHNWKRAEDINIDENILILKNTKYKFIKIISKTLSIESKLVNDLCVDKNHSYVSSNGIINHNSGISFNASLTLLLSTAKLDDKVSEKIAENKVGDFTKTGVIVTAKPEKSRFTIPQKVKFQIPFFKAPNPYVGLEAYITWDNSGIMEGVLLAKQEFDKLSDKEKETVKTFEFNGETKYAFPKVASMQKHRKIVVKHLGEELPITELFTSKVFTNEVLHNLDETVIKPSFELPSQDSADDVDEFLNIASVE